MILLLVGSNADISRQIQSLASPFGWLMASWVLAMFGTGAVYALYPLMMQSVFGTYTETPVF